MNPTTCRSSTPNGRAGSTTNGEPECRDAREGVQMLFRTRAKAMLLGVSLFGGLTASAQYSTPATPAPYNPIALADVTGTPRTAVQAGQKNYQTLSQNPYLGGVPSGKLSATPVQLSLEDAVSPGLKQNVGVVLAAD